MWVGNPRQAEVRSADQGLSNRLSVQLEQLAPIEAWRVHEVLAISV